MITRTTLNTLWLAGGGAIATWLAVSPNPGVPTTTPPATTQGASSGADSSAQELHAQTEKLRSRADAVSLRQSTRNPFRFNAQGRRPSGEIRADASIAPEVSHAPALAAPAAPLLTLAGVAEKKTAEGAHRTAVITGEGQLYLVHAGDSVAGLYTVVSVDPEAVVLRDAAGTELRLILRP